MEKNYALSIENLNLSHSIELKNKDIILEKETKKLELDKKDLEINFMNKLNENYQISNSKNETIFELKMKLVELEHKIKN